MSQSSLYFTNRAAMFEIYGRSVNILERYTLPGFELTTDMFYFGKVSKGRTPNPAYQDLVIVISGTHGLEGAAGSYVQLKLADKIKELQGSDVGVVLIHALNPYGYHFGRRVDANNIDINRAGGTEFITRSAYATIRSVVEPEVWSEVSETAVREQFANLTTARAFQAAVMGGQYDFPTGLFYGGEEGEAACWSIAVLRQMMLNLGTRDHWFSQQPRYITVLDIHTGLGAYGRGELYSPALNANDNLAKRTQEWLGNLGAEVQFPLARDARSSSTPIAGDILSLLVRCSPALAIVPLAMEFGTTMSVSDLVALMAAENWMHHHPGQLSAEEGQSIQDHLSYGFFPHDDSQWLNLVWERCSAIFDAVVNGMLQAGECAQRATATIPRISTW